MLGHAHSSHRAARIVPAEVFSAHKEWFFSEMFESRVHQVTEHVSPLGVCVYNSVLLTEPKSDQRIVLELLDKDGGLQGLFTLAEAMMIVRSSLKNDDGDIGTGYANLLYLKGHDDAVLTLVVHRAPCDERYCLSLCVLGEYDPWAAGTKVFYKIPI